MRLIRWALATLFLTTVVFLLPLPASGAPLPMEPKDPNPLSATYSPIAWETVWKTGSSGRDAIKTLQPREALEAVGFVVYANHEQWTALPPGDQAQLTSAWKGGALLDKEYARSVDWATAAFGHVAGHEPVPAWSVADSNAVAKDLGGSTYASLSGGLKGVVQRIATVVTGDFKPTMPDQAWSSWMSAGTKASFDASSPARFDWSKVTITVDGADAVVTVCNAGALNWACKATRAVASAVAATIDFAKDPLGWITGKAGDGATGVLSWISNTANAATQPNLAVGWWISAYEKGMAIGIVLFGLILLYQFYEKSRGHINAEQFLEVWYFRVPGFFAGLLFGPPLAQFMLQGSSNLADGIIKSMMGSSASDGIGSIKNAVAGASQGKLIGGSFVALLFLILVVICGLLVFLALAVQAVTIYLSAAVFGVAFAWFVSARHAAGSLKIPLLFLGICFARPLLFFMLGIGEALVKNAITLSGDTLTQNLATIVMAVVVLGLAGLAPLLLLKFAPVTPHGMEGATSSVGANTGSGGGGGGGLSKLNQLAQRRSTHGRAGSSGAGGLAGSAARSGTRAAVSASSGGGAAGGTGGGAVSLTKGSAMNGAGSATSKATRSAGGGGSGTSLVGQRLGRTRRHGGGTPSAAAAKVAAARPPSRATGVVRGAGRAAGGSLKAVPGVTAGVSRSARRVGHSLAEGVGGDKQW